MALQPESIESRLARLMIDERRTRFDSKIRAFQMDNKGDPSCGVGVATLAGEAEIELPIDQVISLLEELSRRIDRLERHERTLTVVTRSRDRRQRLAYFAGGVLSTGMILVVWMCLWF